MNKLENKIYCSPLDIELHSQEVYRDHLYFRNTDTVERYCLSESKSFLVGTGNYRIIGNTVIFNLQSVQDENISNWRGRIDENTITFEVDNADYIDIEGDYELIENCKVNHCERLSQKPNKPFIVNANGEIDAP